MNNKEQEWIEVEIAWWLAFCNMTVAISAINEAMVSSPVPVGAPESPVEAR